MSAVPAASSYRSRQSSAQSSGGGKRPPGSMQAVRPPCPGCASAPETYICAICLSKLLKLYKSQTAAHEATRLPAATARAKQGIISGRDQRYLQADAWQRNQKSSGIDAELRRLKLDIDRAEAEVRQKRELLNSRRQALRQARSKLEGQQDNTTLVEKQEKAEPASQTAQTTLAAAHATLSAELAETRRILLGELLEALSITTASERRGTSIGGLRLPYLRAIRGEESAQPAASQAPCESNFSSQAEVPKHEVNAAVHLLVLALRLGTLYLGVKLPFILAGTVTKPTIQAAPRTANAHRYPHHYPLYFSRRGDPEESSWASHAVEPPAKSLEASSTVPPSGTDSQSPVTLGLRMLAYNCYFLGVAAGLPRAAGSSDLDDMLSLLLTAFTHTDTGKRSHLVSQPAHGLLTAEVSSPAYDFRHFLKALDEPKQGANERPNAIDSKGTYVVVPQTRSAEAAQATDDIDPFIIDAPAMQGEPHLAAGQGRLDGEWDLL